MYDTEIYQAALITGVESALIAGIIMQESSWKKDATHRDRDGEISYGLMQVRLDTARRMLNTNELTGAMLIKPYTNILAGAHYLRQSFRKWRDVKDVIASYNAGVPRKNALGQYTNSKGDTKVQRYVDRVLGFYKQYKTSKGSFGPIKVGSVVTGTGVLWMGVVGIIVSLFWVRSLKTAS